MVAAPSDFVREEPNIAAGTEQCRTFTNGGQRLLTRQLKFTPYCRHMCLVYDGFKDLYKVFADGEKIDSGTWTGDGVFEPARLF